MTSSVHDAAAELEAGFKAAMRQLASTVTIVTAASGEAMHGMTATAVTSLSAEPPALLVCVNREASIHPVLHEGQSFCVNILASTHAYLSSVFGGLVVPELRFEHGTWQHDDDGVPFMPDASALVFCSVDLLMDYGTHTIVVGKVKRAMANTAAPPLIYGGGGFLSVTAQQT
jgi:flavin reductase (DIM6/NTAB) family NADH-FMN oxidoreductase RutF